MSEGMISYDGITQEREKASPPYPKPRALEFELRLEEGFPKLKGYEVVIRREGAA
jgi:hypothetical protein